MNVFDGMWIALFFLASGATSALIGRRGKNAREKRVEYFENISGITDEERSRGSGRGKQAL